MKGLFCPKYSEKITRNRLLNAWTLIVCNVFRKCHAYNAWPKRPNRNFAMLFLLCPFALKMFLLKLQEKSIPCTERIRHCGDAHSAPYTRSVPFTKGMHIQPNRYIRKTGFQNGNSLFGMCFSDCLDSFSKLVVQPDARKELDKGILIPAVSAALRYWSGVMDVMLFWPS